MDGESAARRKLRSCCPAVGCNCVFHNGKAEPSTAKLARASLVNAVETFEDVVQVLRFYARAVVADLELVEMTALLFNLLADDVEA